MTLHTIVKEKKVGIRIRNIPIVPFNLGLFYGRVFQKFPFTYKGFDNTHKKLFGEYYFDE